MLQHLTIQNFALIDHYEIDFESGMSVLTGETGAGKSILIDALSLTLGSRADSKMIRHGATRCDINAEFNIEGHAAAITWLTEQDLAHAQDCILRRTINADGKSRAFINGQPVTIQQLSELGEFLVDLHGQHEHQFLLKRDHQLLLLDKFGQHAALLEQIETLHQQWQSLEKEKTRFNQLQQNQNQKEFLSFQLQELTELDLQPDEVEKLETEFKTLNQSENILQRVQNTLAMLQQDDANLVNLLQKAQQQLTPIASLNEQIANAVKNLSQADVLMNESILDLRHYLSHFDLSPERLQEISTRLDHIHRIARKHRIKPDALSELIQNLQKQFDELEKADTFLADIEKQQAQFVAQYQNIAAQLTKKRTQAAKKLSLAITAEMQKLAMIGGEFEIRFQTLDVEIHADGQERCEFWVKSNPGQAFQPLAKVASGGELSRISLAIQVILSAHTVVPTLIFDEVDVGIGGITASVVGKLLKQLSQHVQVLCVTHLPQVAAFGDHHYQVQKNISEDQTFTALKKLSNKARQEEIARMLGGLTITQQSLAHAKELITQAKI